MHTRRTRLLNTQILHRNVILYKTKVTSKPYKTNVQTDSEIVKNSSLDMSKLDIF